LTHPKKKSPWENRWVGLVKKAKVSAISEILKKDPLLINHGDLV
jgi:hypothetical protein